MLTPEQIAALRDRAELITKPVTDYLIKEIAQRIAAAGQLTSTAAYEIWQAQQLGVSQREMKKALRKLLKTSHEQLRTLLTQTAEVGYIYDLSCLPYAHALAFDRNPVLQQIVQAAVHMAEKDFTNLTQTIGFIAPDGKAYPLTKAYKKACDFAFQQVITGAADYNTAVRNACKYLAEQGIQTISYKSNAHTSLEAAVRRNIMGGLGLLQERISQYNHDALGADGWEISAHAASAPDHEPIQGRQYSDAAYQKLNDSLARRIGTLNCGHMAHPIMLGISKPVHSEEQLADFKRQNIQGIDYEGTHYSMYEATQMQRKIERGIRKHKRRILIAETQGDKKTLLQSQIRLARLNGEYARFSKAAGLRTQRERVGVVNFGRAQAARARAAARKHS